MDIIFGRNPKPELFSPYKGILMSNLAESLFDNGYYMTVPHAVETLSAQDIEYLHQVEPKNYKIRGLEPDMKAMIQFRDVGVT